MKNIFLFLFISFAWFAHAQKISPVLLSASGGNNKSANISLHWAVGEVAVSNHFNNPIKLNEGFFQRNVYLTTSNDIPSVNIKIYPNPTTSYINIIDPENAIMNILLVNTQGHNFSINQKNLNELDLSDIPTGVYILKILLKSNHPVEYRIVKI
jgi:hypothetical protein